MGDLHFLHIQLLSRLPAQPSRWRGGCSSSISVLPLSQLCLALCALSSPQSIPDPIATEQIAHTPTSPYLGSECCAVTALSCHQPLPGSFGIQCEQVWCAIHSPVHLEVVLLMKQVMALGSPSDCGDFMVARAGLLGWALVPVLF